MRIPTLLALFLLSILIGGGFIFHTYLVQQQQNQLHQFQPTNIHILPVSESKAIVTWESEASASGEIELSTSPSFDSPFASLQRITIFKSTDSRDAKNPVPRRTHYILIDNLTPNTTYFFKIHSGSEYYPSSPLTIQTKPDTPSTFWSSQEPLMGKVIDTQNKPVTDALVFLSVNNKTLTATTTTDTGSFVLPLTDLGNSLPDLNQNSLQAAIVITDRNTQSTLTLSLPRESSILPQIILGEDQSVTSDALGIETSEASQTAKLDFNKDGIINQQDLTLLSQAVGKKPKNAAERTRFQAYDLNGDGKVDQQDVAIMQKYLP